MSDVPRSKQGDRTSKLLATLPFIFLPLVILSINTREGGPKVYEVVADFVATNAIALAAAVQAISAVVIIWVTQRLATTAREALRATRDQIAVAERTVALQRRDQQVASAPVLELEIPDILELENGLFIEVDLRNRGVTPAVAVALAISESNESGSPGPPRITHTIGTVGIDEISRPMLDMLVFKNIPTPQFPRRSPSAKFATDWMVFTLTYRGSLGQKVARTYRWSANFDDQTKPGVWVQEQMVVMSDVEGVPSLVIDFKS